MDKTQIIWVIKIFIIKKCDGYKNHNKPLIKVRQPELTRHGENESEEINRQKCNSEGSMKLQRGLD